jgi:tyrosyl-tRNA synthetase
MVGDPSGKSEERNLLSEETLNHNLAGIKRQLEKYLDFTPTTCPMPPCSSITMTGSVT